MTDSEGFHADGYESLVDKHLDEVRPQVELEFAARLEEAGWLKRWRIKKQMENEITKRLDALAPPDALY